MALGFCSKVYPQELCDLGEFSSTKHLDTQVVNSK